MKKKLIFIFTILSIFILSSCSSNEVNSEFEQRLDILYSHTIEMVRLSNDKQLGSIGLDSSHLIEENISDNENKIIQLEKSFNIVTEGNFEERVLQLEDKMAEMMYSWAQNQ